MIPQLCVQENLLLLCLFSFLFTRKGSRRVLKHWAGGWKTQFHLHAVASFIQIQVPFSTVSQQNCGASSIPWEPMCKAISYRWGPFPRACAWGGLFGKGGLVGSSLQDTMWSPASDCPTTLLARGMFAISGKFGLPQLITSQIMALGSPTQNQTWSPRFVCSSQQ